MMRKDCQPCFVCHFSSVEENKHVILDTLEENIRCGKLLEDNAQKKAAIKLSRLYSTLQRYLLKEHQYQHRTDTDRIPRGLYIYGEVGCGKSMLMDTLYYELNKLELPCTGSSKFRRVHFHAFMADVHTRIHSLKISDLLKRGRNFHVDTSDEFNPILRVANDISNETKVLCFDEFQVTDVADALIVSQLFRVLFHNGTVCVATSNRPPKDLYEGGINRSYFLPFIDLLERYCIVHSMENKIDYRSLLADGVESFFFVEDITEYSSDKIELFFKSMLSDQDDIEIELPTAFGRSIILKSTDPNGQVCMMSFNELCKVEFGASDYRAIAENFRVIMLKGIPILNLRRHDEARRFITLVDELYESKCVLACSAAAEPEHLFEGKVSNVKDGKAKESIKLKPGEAFGIDAAQNIGRTIGELASVRELRFAFARASSRLVEMCSKDWWVKQGVLID